MKDLKEVVTFTDIKFWIQIGTLIAGLAIGYTVLCGRVDAIHKECVITTGTLDAHLDDYQMWQDKQDGILLKIQVQLAEIQKDIAYIKMQLK